MKVGVIFSGVIRQFDPAFFDQNVIHDKNHEYTIIASCNTENTESKDSFHVFSVEECAIPEHWGFVGKKTQWNNYNTVSMYFHNKRAFIVLLERVPDVDIVLKYRSDIITNQKLELPSSVSSNTIYVPDSNQWKGINDQIAYGDKESMKIYCGVYDKIEEYVKKNHVSFHPETLLLHHLKTENIKVETFNYKYHLNPKRY